MKEEGFVSWFDGMHAIMFAGGSMVATVCRQGSPHPLTVVEQKSQRGQVRLSYKTSVPTSNGSLRHSTTSQNSATI